MSGGQRKAPKYDAFISYSHKDASALLAAAGRRRKSSRTRSKGGRGTLTILEPLPSRLRILRFQPRLPTARSGEMSRAPMPTCIVLVREATGPYTACVQTRTMARTPSGGFSRG